MNNFYAVHHTDVGIKKKKNQDSLLLQAISNGSQEILLAVVCDGMGGMSKGELASATGVRAFSDWFTKIYMQKGGNLPEEEIFLEWHQILTEINQKLIQHGKQKNIQLGTTVTAVLVFSDGRYLAEHVGDTRIYQISNNIDQMTEDHTFVAREVRKGNMTAEQAAYDPRKNVLLQCIGVNAYFEPQFFQGKINQGEELLLCSDGFRHTVTDSEIIQFLYPDRMNSEEEMKQELIRLVELNKERKETDNISAILIKLK